MKNKGSDFQQARIANASDTGAKTEMTSDASAKAETQSDASAETPKIQPYIDPDVFVKNPVIDNKSVALYTLWFGLDYGSILTAYSLWQVLKNMGYHPFLLEKSPNLWTDHYAETNNIAGKFIFKNCDVLRCFHDEESRAALDKIRIRLAGSDVIWNPDIIGWKNLSYFFLDDENNFDQKSNIRISYASACGKLSFPAREIHRRNDIGVLLRKFQSVSVRDFRDALSLNEQFYINPEITVDPVFLCPKEEFLSRAESAVAAEIERERRFFFTYFKNGDERKQKFLIRGNDILLERCHDPMRNFIDINRYQESKDEIGVKPAYYILVEDWLFYLIHSDFVMTDDYYGICFALLFEKDFVAVIRKDLPDTERYVLLMEQLDLSERLVFEDDDFKKKEYLFRKPIRYQNVNEKLNELRQNALRWLEKAMADAEKSGQYLNLTGGDGR